MLIISAVSHCPTAAGRSQIYIIGMLMCCATYRNVSSCLLSVSFCPGGCITCLNMDAFEPHSSYEHLPKSARDSPLSITLPMTTSLGWPTREPSAVLLSGMKRIEDESHQFQPNIYIVDCCPVPSVHLISKATIDKWDFSYKQAYFRLVNPAACRGCGWAWHLWLLYHRPHCCTRSSGGKMTLV